MAGYSFLDQFLILLFRGGHRSHASGLMIMMMVYSVVGILVVACYTICSAHYIQFVRSKGENTCFRWYGYRSTTKWIKGNVAQEQSRKLMFVHAYFFNLVRG